MPENKKYTKKILLEEFYSYKYMPKEHYNVLIKRINDNEASTLIFHLNETINLFEGLTAANLQVSRLQNIITKNIDMSDGLEKTNALDIKKHRGQLLYMYVVISSAHTKGEINIDLQPHNGQNTTIHANSYKIENNFLKIYGDVRVYGEKQRIKKNMLRHILNLNAISELIIDQNLYL